MVVYASFASFGKVKNRPLQMLERDNLLAILVLFISGKVDR